MYNATANDRQVVVTVDCRLPKGALSSVGFWLYLPWYCSGRCRYRTWHSEKRKEGVRTIKLTTIIRFAIMAGCRYYKDIHYSTGCTEEGYTPLSCNLGSLTRQGLP